MHAILSIINAYYENLLTVGNEMKVVISIFGNRYNDRVIMSPIG